MAITQESHEKWKKERELRKANMLLGSPTVDQSYIKNYSNDVSSFLAGAADRYNNVKWGQSQAALNSYNNAATELKYKKVLIEDWLSKNAEAGNYDDLLNIMSSAESDIKKIGEQFSKLHKDMSAYNSADEYNAAVDTSEKLSFDLSKFYTDATNKAIAVYDMQNMRQYDENVFKNYLTATGKLLNASKYKSLFDYYSAEFDTVKGQGDLIAEFNNYLSSTDYKTRDEFLNAYDYAKSAKEVQDNTPRHQMERLAMSDPDFEKIVSSWKGGIDFQKWHNTDYLTEDEKKVVTYYLAKGNGDTHLADNYLDTIGSTLAYREGEQIAGKYQDSTWDSVWYNFGNAAANSLNFTDYLYEMANGGKGQYNLNKRVGQLYVNNQWKPYYSASEVAASINHENLPDGFWETFDSALTSLGQQLPSLLYSTVISFGNERAGRLVGSAITGLSATGNTYREALIQGYSHDEATAYSILNGTSEAVLSYLLDGVGKAGGAVTKPLTNKLKGVVTKALANVAGEHGESMLLKILSGTASWGVKKLGNASSEFLEEYLQSVLDSQMRNWTLNENNEFELFDEDAFEEGLVGAFSSFLTGTAGDVVNVAQQGYSYIQYANLGSKLKTSDNVQAVLNYASSLETPETKRLIKPLTSADNISNNLLGRIYVEVQKEIHQKFENAVGSDQIVKIFENIAQSTDSVYIKQFALQEATLNLIRSTDADILKTVSTEGNTQATEVKENAVTDQQVDSGVPDGEVESVLPDVSAEGPEPDVVADWAFKERGLERLTDQQKYIRSVGEAFGRKVRFANLDKSVKGKDGKRRLFSPNGYFDPKTGEIWINTSTKVKHNPLEFIIKHELAEFAETNPESYSKFMEAVQKSKAFEAWLRKKTGSKDRTVNEMVADLAQKEQDVRSKYGIEQGPYEATQEVYANFVGDVLFEKDNRTLDDLIKGVDKRSKPRFIQALLDIITWLKEKLKGNKQLTFELVRLETKYKRALREAQKAWEQKTADSKKATDEGGEQYSLPSNVDNYTEKQYNDFGWVAANNILTGKELKQLYSQFADAELLGHNYPKTPKGEVIIVTGDKYGTIDSIVFIKGTNKHPIVTKIYRYVTFEQNNREISTNEVVEYEQRGYDNANEIIEAYAGYSVFSRHTIQNSMSFREYKNQRPRSASFENSRKRSNRTTSIETNSRTLADSSESAFSMPEDGQYSLPDGQDDTDYTAEMDALDEQFRNGEITRDEYRERINEFYSKAGEEYGTIPKGETVTGNEDFSNPVPQSVDGKKNVKRHVRTIIEGGELTPEMVEVTKQQILSGDLSYTPTSNSANMQYADRAIQAGTAQGIWDGIANGDDAPNAGGIAIGEALLKLAIERKDAVSVVKLIAELSEVGTRMGQAVQALSLLKRMNGVGQLYYLQKSVKSLNKDLQKKYGNKAPIITIDPAMAQMLAEAKTTEDFDYTYGAIMQDLGAKVPSTFLDKWNAWRYMAMLFNPTTHIRNIFGNAVFSPVVKLKDIIGWLGERFRPQGERTKSVVIGKDFKNFAKEDFKNVESILKGTGKMSPKRGIQDNKKIFKTRWLEWMRQKNFDLLESEDAIFLKSHYVRALGGYLQAQKVDIKNVKPDVLAKAREYAIGEALKATYRDTSAIANLISSYSNKNAIANVLIEGILPFKKTPINIVKRGFEYSPYGVIKTLTKGLYDLKKGNITASQWIDGLAANLTGTGIFALGYLLSSLGIVKGAMGDEEEDWFDKMLGSQEYSIEIGGFSYTMDWAAPACMPFFMGVTMQETAEEEGNADFVSSTISALGNGLEPYINMSMLSGIRDVIESTKYSDSSEMVQTIASDVILSYFSQALPTIGSKVSNLFVEDRRTSYIDKTSCMPKIMQQALDKVYGKVPWLANQRANYINAWGEKESNGGFFRRFLQNFVSPGYISDVEVTEIDEEVKRLAESTGEQSVFPDKPKKYVKFKGYTKDLTAEEYEEYAVNVGQDSADYVSECVKNAEYKKLTDEQKVEVITNLYAYANAKAKTKLSYTYEEVNAMYGGEITKSKWYGYNSKTKKALVQEYFLEKYNKPYLAERNGGSAVDYYIDKAKKE